MRSHDLAITYYRAILLAYPRKHRTQYGDEILEILAISDSRSLASVTRHTCDLLKSAKDVHMRTIKTGWGEALSLFATSAPVIMLAVSAAVVFAITYRYRAGIISSPAGIYPVQATLLLIARSLGGAAIMSVLVAALVYRGYAGAAITTSVLALALTITVQMAAAPALGDMFYAAFFALELSALSASKVMRIDLIKHSPRVLVLLVLAGTLPAALWLFGATTINVQPVVRLAIIAALLACAVYAALQSSAARRVTVLLAAMLVPVAAAPLRFPHRVFTPQPHEIAAMSAVTYILPAIACVLILMYLMRRRSDLAAEDPGGPLGEG